jgi:hypothetical protein
MVHGEKARIALRRRSLVTSPSFDPDAPGPPILARLKVFDLERSEIAQRQITVPPVGFASIEVDRDEISLLGERRRRLQMLAELTFGTEKTGVPGATLPVNPGEWVLDVSCEVINKKHWRGFDLDGYGTSDIERSGKSCFGRNKQHGLVR